MQPALGMVYKLVEINKISKIKFSSDIFKATLPGKKNVYRIWVEGNNTPAMDLIAYDDEKLEIEKEIIVWTIGSDTKTVVTPVKIECLLNKVWEGKLLIKQTG